MKANYLRTIRERRGLTQAQLADKSGVRQARISRLENTPMAKQDYDTVVDLARALEIDPSSLRFGPDPSKQEAVAS